MNLAIRFTAPGEDIVWKGTQPKMGMKLAALGTNESISDQAVPPRRMKVLLDARDALWINECLKRKTFNPLTRGTR
jgi:hypothetical protein